MTRVGADDEAGAFLDFLGHVGLWLVGCKVDDWASRCKIDVRKAHGKTSEELFWRTADLQFVQTFLLKIRRGAFLGLQMLVEIIVWENCTNGKFLYAF